MTTVSDSSLFAPHHGRIERVNEHLRIGALDHLRQRADVVSMVMRDDDLAQVIRLAADALDGSEDAVGAAGNAGVDKRQPVGLLVEIRAADAEPFDRVDAGDDLHALPPGTVWRGRAALGKVVSREVMPGTDVAVVPAADSDRKAVLGKVGYVITAKTG